MTSVLSDGLECFSSQVTFEFPCCGRRM